MKYTEIIKWLLQGDVSIQYQVKRDLLDEDDTQLQKSIALEGWGKHFLSQRKNDGHWGDRFYQPKWTSTHYTLLDLRNLCLSPNNLLVKDSIDKVLKHNIADDGGIRLGPSTRERSDVCVNAMFLNYASYFEAPEERLQSIVESILNEIMPDGGFNCRTSRSGARHSSLHTTISVLEGLSCYLRAGHTYKKTSIQKAITSSIEFILMHRLYLSDRTGTIIHKDFLNLHYPCRWKYDILRGMDYFQQYEVTWDDRMRPAIDQIKIKKNKDGLWNLNASYPGQVHLKMETAGNPSRWNTLRILRIKRKYDLDL